MFGSRRQLSASAISTSILRGALKYATVMGIICFSVQSNRSDGRLVAVDRQWYKWFCLVARIAICVCYINLYMSFFIVLGISHLKIIICLRMIICLVCAVVTLVMQFWHGHRVLYVLNRFLRLYWRVKALPSRQDMGFGGKSVLCMLLLKVVCLSYEFLYLIPTVISDFDMSFAMTFICDIYNTVNAAMILHVCFVGYLSIGIIYDQVNSYVRHELRQLLDDLKQPQEGSANRRQLKAAGHRLDECLSIYDEIHQVCNSFHRLFEFPLCIILMFGILSMALVAFFMVTGQFDSIALWILAVKLLLDLLLLTLVVHGAASSSRVVRRLSLDNYYLSDDKEWHMKLEMFLNRLNYNEFRVRPLGLFDVSNELILVFLSALVTYLTYILQYGMQWDML